MKKIFLFFISFLLTLPLLAQTKTVAKIGVEAVTQNTTGLMEIISRQLARQQGVNMRIVPLEFVTPASATPSNFQALPCFFAASQGTFQKMNITPEMNLVKAEFFPPKELSRHMKEFDDLELYSTVSGGSIFHRGMVLSDLQSLKNVLTKGLEWKKTSYNRIFASRYLSVALDHAYINPGQLPVLVQIPETDRLSYSNVIGGDDWTVTFGRDIPVDMLSNVRAFLRINNKPGWYDVKLQDDTFIFSPISTPLVK